MNAATKKLTTAAVCTALAVVMCVITAYLPLSFMPLYLAAFCIFLACKRGNVYYGVLCAVATAVIMFFLQGVTVKWLTFVIMFAPYGVISSFLHKFNYFKVKSALIRVAIAAVYFNATFAAVFFIAKYFVSIGNKDINVLGWANMIGGYAVLALIATVVLLPLDFIFSTLGIVVLKKIPAPVTRLKKAPPVTPKDGDGDGDDVELDIFGYEIRKDNENNDVDGGKKG